MSKGTQVRKANLDRPDREGTRALVAHVDASIFRDFKVLAAENFATTDAMMNEALALLFKKHGKRVPPLIRRKLATLGMKLD